MKNFILLFLILLTTQICHAQWQPNNASTTDTNSIYHNGGNVGIGTGTSTISSKLEIVSDNSLLRLRGTQMSANTPFDILHLGMQGGTGAMNLTFRVGYPYPTGVGVGGKLDFLKVVNGNTILATNDTGQPLGSIGIGTTSPSATVEVRGPSIRISDIPVRYLEISQDALGQPFGRNLTNGYAGGRQFKLSSWSHLPDNSGSVFKDIVHFDGYNLLLLKDNGGNVGIGTSTPAAKFHLVGGYGRIENADESSIQYKANTPGQFWDVGTNIYGYYIFEGNTHTYDLVVNKNGNVGIGVINADAKLAVKGTIHTQEVKVDLVGSMVPDYVFENSYKLPPLTEVQNYINENKHLPEVPSAKEMEENGMKLKEMNLTLLKKVEELTLYMIELKKENESFKQTSEELVKQNAELSKRISKIEKN
jgi:hypothetical protein